MLDTWDVMSGAVHPQGDVLVFDDNGAEPALDAAELLAGRGAASSSSRLNGRSRPTSEA